MPKKILRKTLVEKRKTLSKFQALELGELIQDRFLESHLFQKAQTLALYAPVHGEVDTLKVFRAARDVGKQVLFPVVDRETLLFRCVDSLAELKSGTYGIFEPDAACPVVAPSVADVIIVPGVAFDIGGQRIGYGKGYYDRTVHAFEGLGRLVGFCYDFQVVDAIVGEPHDVRVDWLFTESRVLRASKT